MSDYFKLNFAIVLLLLNISEVSSQVSDFKNFNFIIGNYYKVTLSNGWETEGELLNSDSASIKIQTKYKTFTIPVNEIIKAELINNFGLSKSINKNPPKLGLKGGMNFAQAVYNSESSDSKSGVDFGIFCEIYTSDNFSIQPGINYIQKGSRYVNDIATITQKMDYLEFPVNFNAYFLPGKVQPFLSAGFYFSTRVKSSQTQQYKISEDTYEYDGSDFYDKTDIGFLIGGGVSFAVLKEIDLFVNFNYSHGFNNIAKTENLDHYQNSIGTVSNRGIELTAGIKFY